MFKTHGCAAEPAPVKSRRVRVLLDGDAESEELPTSFLPSGWAVLGAASQLGHRRSCQCTGPVGRPLFSVLSESQAPVVASHTDVWVRVKRVKRKAFLVIESS